MPSEPPIIIVTHEFAPTRGGIATFTEEMALAGSRIGRDVAVWAPQATNPLDESFPFPVKRMPIKGSQDLRCQLQAARFCYARRRDLNNAILYLTDPGSILAIRFLLLLKLISPKRVLLTLHGSEVNTFASNPLRKATIRLALQRADRISVPSRFTKDLLLKTFPLTAGKTIVTPGALRSGFKVVRSQPARTDDIIRVISVGRIHPRKGQDRLLEALERLPSRLRSKVQYWVVGSGNKHGFGDRLRSRAQEAQVDIEFFGDVSNEELQRLYSEADVFALTSMPFKHSVEGFGLVYLEAAAHGLPIVAHRTGGVADAVLDGENGILVDPEDSEGLTTALVTLIECESIRIRLGRQGIAWSRSNTWDRSFQRLLETGQPTEGIAGRE